MYNDALRIILISRTTNITSSGLSVYYFLRFTSETRRVRRGQLESFKIMHAYECLDKNR